MSPKKHWHSRGKKLLSNIMAVAMLTGAAVVGVGASGAGVASATLSGSSFNGADGVLDVTNANHTVTDQPDPIQGADTTNYSQGPKENDFCPTVSTGQAPNKTDLDHLYLGVERSGSDVFAYLAWHRFTADGTATIDFELNQSTSKCNVAGNDQNPIRTEGDLLITYDFQGGASVAINARLWVGTAQTGHWGTAESLDATVAEASFGTPKVNPDELFGEAVVNLAKVKGFFSPNICKNVSSVYAKSRTGSDSAFDSASIKDFTAPIFQSISNCGSLKIIKTDDAGAALAGAAFELFKDNNGVIGATTGKTCTTVLDNSNPPQATCTIPNLFPGTYWVHETSAPAGHTKAADTPVTITVDHTT